MANGISDIIIISFVMYCILPLSHMHAILMWDTFERLDSKVNTVRIHA